MSGAKPLVLEIWDVVSASAEFGGTVLREILSGERTIVSREKARIDPAEHVYRARYDVSVRSPSGDANFEHEEVLRVLTVDDVVAELTAAGFTDIDAQTRPDMLEPESGDREFWFLAGRP